MFIQQNKRTTPHQLGDGSQTLLTVKSLKLKKKYKKKRPLLNGKVQPEKDRKSKKGAKKPFMIGGEPLTLTKADGSIIVLNRRK